MQHLLVVFAEPNRVGVFAGFDGEIIGAFRFSLTNKLSSNYCSRQLGEALRVFYESFEWTTA